MAGPPLKPNPVRPVPPALNSPERLANPPPAEPAVQPLPGWRLNFRKAVAWLFLIMLGCVVMQIALAGAGLLGDEQYWITGVSAFLNAHIFFVHVLELLPLLIAVAGFIGADKEAGWSGIAILVLVEVQYAFIGLEGVARSFHVLNALIIFTFTLLMTLSRIPWRPTYIDGPSTA
ncbi:MAG: hypothetical protein WC876_00705 [Candidatus Thermoplasmatota archaeon]|jgi:hypothetical protein